LKKHYANTQNLRRGQGLTWSSHLAKELSETLRSGPNGKLLGLIICGPLAPLEIPPWVADSKDILKQHGLIIEEPYKQSSGLWLDNSNKLIALGAKIFGHRDLLGEPTYLDTLPGLSIFARKNNNEIDWIDLIEPGEQDGGVLYEKSIKGKFQLNNNEIKLNVFLKKEDKDWRGSLSPLRKGEINFKSVGHEKTIIDIKIEMRPTKGIAKIELIPRNMRLGNRGLEYSIMNPIKKEDLPKLRQAWPETIKVGISKDPLDFAVTQPYDDFFEEEYNSNRYIRKLDVVKSCLTAGVGKSANGRIKWLKKIDQDGKAGSPEGQKIIEQISSKLESDFRKIVSIRGSQNDGDIQKILIRGAWLWGACPKSLVKHLEEYFRSHDRVHFGQPWTYFLEAASRCFLNPARYKILFSAIRSRIKNNQTSTTFPIQSSRSIVKILQYRDRGHEGLDRETAELFVKEAIKSIEGEVNRHEFSMLQSHQKFWQGILLFFLLMRFRIIQDDFLDPDNSSDREKFNRVFNCLGKAYGLTQNAKFKKIENDIKEYQHKRGAPGIIKTLVDLVESDVDNNEEPTVHEMQADPNLIIPVEETTNTESEVSSEGISDSDIIERKELLKKDLIETREALEDEIDSTQIQVLKYHIEHLEGEIENL
jgi:hypothetical protein